MGRGCSTSHLCKVTRLILRKRIISDFLQFSDPHYRLDFLLIHEKIVATSAYDSKSGCPSGSLFACCSRAAPVGRYGSSVPHTEATCAHTGIRSLVMGRMIV